jgi:glycosyltransferase involved in cell wall biosynthesis
VRILVVLHDYLPAHTGGSEIHAHQTARELSRRGHQVTALFTERDLGRQDGDERAGTLDGVRTLEVVHQREYGDVRESWEEQRSLAILRRKLAELQPEVVHFHHLALWGSRALVAAREAGARVVVTLHDYHLLCDVATLLRPDGSLCTTGPRGDCSACLERHPTRPESWPELGSDPARAEILTAAARLRHAHHKADLASAHVVIAPSRFLAGLLEEAGFLRATDCEILKAGYPGPVFPPRRRDPTRPLRIGYVGGIYPSKGVHVLAEALAILAVDTPFEAHVHGHLEWFPDYVAGLRRTVGSAPVHFHGPYPSSAVDDVLAGVDCLVLPSIWYENMPITIHEAHRHGLPLVVTDLGGMRETVIEGVTGLRFPRGDARALAGALRRLATDAALYDRLAAARPAVPTLEAVVDRLEALYAGATR